MPPRVRTLVLLFGTLVLAPLATGCNRPAAAPEEEAKPAPVKAVAARTLSLGEWTDVVGTAQPLPTRAARISAAVEGRVASVLADGGKSLAEGQRVSKGQAVVRLDDQVARANRDKVAAGLKELDEVARQADLDVELAQIDVKRLENLGRTSGNRGDLPLVSRIELEKAQVARRSAESKQKGVVAKREAGKAELKALDEQLALYTLRAPIDGRLGMLQVVAGQTLSVGAPVADVIDLDEIDVLCFVPPSTAARLALDQPARLAADGETETPSAAGPTGKVVFIAPQAQAETGSFAVKLRYPNSDLRLRANTIVRAQVETKPEKERLTLPESALLEDQDPPGVVIVQDLKTEMKEGKEEKTGKARKLRARVGVRDRNWHVVEILGLEDPEKKEQVPLEDTLFVVEGAQGLQDGDAVKLEEEEEEPEK